MPFRAPNEDGEARINRRHTRGRTDGGPTYREPSHPEADRSEVPHDYEGPITLERVTTPRASGNVTEMVEVPDRKAKRLAQKETESTCVGEAFEPSTLDFGPDTESLESVAKEENPVIEALPDDEAEGEGSSERCVGPTTQAMVDGAGAGMYEGREALLERVRDLDPVDDVDWQAELADQQASEKEVLLEIRDQLKEMEQPTAQAETVAKALEQAAEDDEAEDGPDSPGERLLEQLDDLSAMLEARMDGEAEDGGQGGARKGVAVEKSDSRLGQLTLESWRELADCLSGEAREKCPVR